MGEMLPPAGTNCARKEKGRQRRGSIVWCLQSQSTTRPNIRQQKRGPRCSLVACARSALHCGASMMCAVCFNELEDGITRSCLPLHKLTDKRGSRTWWLPRSVTWKLSTKCHPKQVEQAGKPQKVVRTTPNGRHDL